jgi:hypothetical protein
MYRPISRAVLVGLVSQMLCLELCELREGWANDPQISIRSSLKREYQYHSSKELPVVPHAVPQAVLAGMTYWWCTFDLRSKYVDWENTSKIRSDPEVIWWNLSSWKSPTLLSPSVHQQAQPVQWSPLNSGTRGIESLGDFPSCRVLVQP